MSGTKQSNDSELKGFWRDGISWLPPKRQLTKKYVNDCRKIETKAWIGSTGQSEFKTIVHFGNKALSNYANGMDLTECIPNLESKAERIEINMKKRIVNLKLD